MLDFFAVSLSYALKLLNPQISVLCLSKDTSKTNLETGLMYEKIQYCGR